jgi:uncharacterized protein (TIGR03083 family)
MDLPQERVKIAVAESARLKAYLCSLPSEAWSQPSACDRWTVQDVVAHLAWVAESYIERIHQSVQGDALSPEGLPAPGVGNAAAFAAGNAQRALSRRERLGEQVLADFVAQNDQLNQLMATLSSDDWDRPHYYASLGIEPLRLRPDLWISELAMHGWDIRSRFESEAHLSDDSLPVMMDVVPGQLERFIFRSGPRLAAPVRYRWELIGAGSSNSDIIVEGDKAMVESATTEKADVIFHCDIESYIFIAFGRLSINAAIGAERLTIDGDKKLALEFQHWFPGM